MDISYLLPTLGRPGLNQVIDSIYEQSKGYEFEILLMSPDSYNDSRILCLNEVVNFRDEKCNGQVPCYNVLAREARGKYLVHTMDDHIFTNPIKHSIDLLESDTFKNRKFKICTMKSGNPCPLPPYGTRLGSCLKNPIDFGNHLLMRFPVVAKETVMNYLNGYLYHPEFFSHAVDNYLGFYVAFNGEPALESETRLQEVSLTSNPKYIVVDCNTFLALSLNLINGGKNYVEEPNPDLVQMYLDSGKFLA